MCDKNKTLCAYEIHQGADMAITVAPVGRDWMDASDRRFAYRCSPPLTIANQAGWVIACRATFVATWDGRIFKEGVRIDFEPSPEHRDTRVTSHFGSGVVTISLPYLFRTPEGVNLWVKGPSNYFKDGAHPLEGIVETDWLPATFTMNWKLTRTDHPVRFERGEPICMVLPVPRGLAESMEPIRVPLSRDPELDKQYHDWSRLREEFNAAIGVRGSDESRRGWQKWITPGA